MMRFDSVISESVQRQGVMQRVTYYSLVLGKNPLERLLAVQLCLRSSPIIKHFVVEWTSDDAHCLKLSKVRTRVETMEERREGKR